MKSAPEAPRCSASASRAGITGTEGWPLIVICTSSKSRAWEAAPLMSAACCTLVRIPPPMTVACGLPPLSSASSRRMRESGSFVPASVTPNQSSTHWRARTTTSAGKDSNEIARALAAIARVTPSIGRTVIDPPPQPSRCLDTLAPEGKVAKNARTLGEFRAFGEGAEIRCAGRRLPLGRFDFLGQSDPCG